MKTSFATIYLGIMANRIRLQSVFLFIETQISAVACQSIINFSHEIYMNVIVGHELYINLFIYIISFIKI